MFTHIKIKSVIVFSVILLLVVAFLHFMPVLKKEASSGGSTETESSRISTVSSSEIKKILATTDLPTRVKLYRALMDRVGPVEAQDELYRSGLPFDGQSHLLNHESGEYLYEKFGFSGIKYCRDYFLSSCYHGFVIDTISDGGMAELAKTFNVCFESGPTVYIQCAHGIGHGFLANAGYKNLTEALATCDKAVAKIPNFPGYNCYDGVFMENIWGVHDGTPSPDRWIKPNDPVYPCDDPRIVEKYKNACWSNQPSLDYQLFQGNIKKVADVCMNLNNDTYKATCFDGLARQIHPLTNGSVQETYRMCSMMPSDNWKNYCLYSNVAASYSVGDRNIPFEICDEIEPNGKSGCYSRLIGVMRAYEPSKEGLKTMCSKINDSLWQNECLQAAE